MIGLENLRCPVCGADVAPPPAGARSVVCSYCGHEAMVHELAPPQPPAPQPPAPQPPAPQPPAAQAKSSGSRTARRVWSLVLVLAVLGGPWVVIFMADAGLFSGFQWHQVVIPVAIDGDGVDDFVGVYASRRYEKFRAYVAAFDGAKRAELWSAGPFGTAAHELKVAVAGASVVVTDPQPVLHILALKTGKETAKVPLSDKARTLCAPPGAKGTLWLETIDKKSVLIDLATAAAHPAPRPASCPGRIPYKCRHVRNARAGCIDGAAAPKVDGFDAEFVLSQGDDSVAVGSRSPGTPTPMAVGLDPKSRTVRWKRPLVGAPPSAWDAKLHAVDMANGRLLAEYTRKKVGRLMAVDVRTGKLLWDVPVPNTERTEEAWEMVITSTRVYLPHSAYLELFNIEDGAHLATLGEL